MSRCAFRDLWVYWFVLTFKSDHLRFRLSHFLPSVWHYRRRVRVQCLMISAFHCVFENFTHLDQSFDQHLYYIRETSNYQYQLINKSISEPLQLQQKYLLDAVNTWQMFFPLKHNYFLTIYCNSEICRYPDLVQLLTNIKTRSHGINKIMANAYCHGLLDANNEKCYNLRVFQTSTNILVKTRKQLHLHKGPIYYWSHEVLFFFLQ